MDGQNWEFHFLRTIDPGPAPAQPRSRGVLARLGNYLRADKGGERVDEVPRPRGAFIRFGTLDREAMEKFIARENEPVMDGLLDLARFLLTASLPFPAIDRYEYWLLDSADGLPLALIHSCSTVAEQSAFSADPEWRALPAAILPVDAREDEQRDGSPPVNYRLERLVAERAGTYPKASWFERENHEANIFPPLMVREDWVEPAQKELCQRYLERLSPRLLMLHGLGSEDRKRMEIAARPQALEVSKYFSLYPGMVDEELMKSIRVEARLRESMGQEAHTIKYRWR